MTTELILASTLHDPEGRLVYLITEIGPNIGKYFKNKVICLTSATAERERILFEKIGFHVLIEEGNIINKSYTKVIKFSMDLLESDNSKIMYIDFDRILHWYKNYKAEFEKTLSNYNEFDFVLIGRTDRAHKSHHEALYKTELILNKLFSQVLHLNHTMDMLCANWILTKSLAKKILSIKLYSSTGFYLYWPFVLWRENKNKIYIQVEGQEFETPDRFIDEIKKIGYNTWIETLDTGREWNRRVSIINDTFIEFMNHGEFAFENATELQNL